MMDSSSEDIVYGAKFKVFPDTGKVAIYWGSPVYSNIAAYYGKVDDREQILQDKQMLFLGFADGTPNIISIENPSPFERLFFVLSDAPQN